MCVSGKFVVFLLERKKEFVKGMCIVVSIYTPFLFPVKCGKMKILLA